jgi:membrane protein DedA with SNARE-associated domain
LPAINEQASVIVAILLLAFFAQALKEVGIPSPGLTQSLLLYAGYQFSSGGIHFGIGIIFFTFLGSLCGAYLIFCLARFGGNKLLAKLNRHVGISPEAMEKVRNKITTYSFITVTVGRSIPGLMVPTSIVAGTLRMPIGKFLLGIVFPLSLWIVVLTTLGSTFGHFTPQIEFSPNRFLFFLGVLIALSAMTGIVYIWKRKSRSQKEPREPYRIG